MELDLLELDTANTLDELERELDEFERELDEMELERELEELDLLELNELERELDETNSELDELKTGITELDFELEKFEDETELICDIDENELLLKELIATELETTTLLELEVATLDTEDLA